MQQPARLVGDLVVGHHLVPGGPHPTDRGDVAAAAGQSMHQQAEQSALRRAAKPSRRRAESPGRTSVVWGSATVIGILHGR
jgi:hypothetical protein